MSRIRQCEAMRLIRGVSQPFGAFATLKRNVLFMGDTAGGPYVAAGESPLVLGVQSALVETLEASELAMAWL